jgi:putative nucleotidyltransferase with HDIG domain
MNGSGQLQSLFSQKLDRAVFGTYFLGSVVPTALLAGVLHRYALPGLQSDATTTLALVGLLLAVGLLSLASFFALRRLLHSALRRMDSDNFRLGRILAASRELSGAIDARAVADTASGCALALTDARAAYVLLQPGRDKGMLVCESAGEGAARLYQSNQERIGELVETSVESNAPWFLTNGDVSGAGDAGLSCIASLPFSLSNDLRGAFVLLHTAPDAWFSSEQIDAVTSLAGFTSIALENADLQFAQRNFFSHMTEILVTALDAQLDQGDSRAGHPNRIAAIANSLGRELRLDAERLQRLHFGALLHDIGYLKIDRALHYDPVQCQAHPVLGHRMLSRIRLWQEVAPIVLHHHEWFDGSGYPENRVGRDIPLESRIVAVADFFDELTHEAADRPALSVEESLARVGSGSGERFDPRVVEALCAIVKRGELVA